MTTISKILPACGFVIAVALVGVTSAFKEAPKAEQDLWVLKSGATVGSTTPSDYELQPRDCEGQVNFCGFEAPADGSIPTQPDINSVTDLTTDLEALQSDPNGTYNQSGAVHYEL